MSGGLLGPPVTPGGPLGPPGASGYSRGLSGASWGLRLLPGPLGPPGASGYSRGSLGPPGASGYSRGPLGPPGASGYSRGPFHSLLNRYGGGAGLCGVGAPLGSAGKKRAAPRALLPVDAGPRGGRASAPPRRACDRPLGLSFSQHREKIGWGSLGICIVVAGIVRSTLERSRCGSRFRGCGNVSAR